MRADARPCSSSVRSWSRRSVRSKPRPFLSFFASFSALVPVDLVLDLLDQVYSTSPIPRMREAMRCGVERPRVPRPFHPRRGSESAALLPRRTDSAAPRFGVAVRFGQDHACQRQGYRQMLVAALMASWPAMLSTTNSVSCGAALAYETGRLPPAIMPSSTCAAGRQYRQSAHRHMLATGFRLIERSFCDNVHWLLTCITVAMAALRLRPRASLCNCRIAAGLMYIDTDKHDAFSGLCR